MNRIQQNFTLLFGLALLASTPTLAQQVFPAAPREVLVKFRTANPERLQEIERNEDIEYARGIGGTGVLRLRSRSRDTFTLIRRLAALPDVEYAEPNYIVQAIGTPNDPYYPNLWGMAKISAPAAWGVSTGSTATVVGVVDTGVDYSHPDLAANIWSAPSQFTVTVGGATITCPAGSHGFNAITNTCDPMDDNSHGTHVSGTIGAAGNNGLGVVGVNWTARILGAKFLNQQGSGTTSDAVDAIEFAVQTKQLGLANVGVLSNSWGGGGSSQTLLNEINRAYQNGILFVAAAGNNGTNNDASPFYPACYNAPNVIAVAATDSNDALASWSNYGATSVDLAAPGVNIESTIAGGSYAYYSGTSMATPHVSGAAALVLSVCTLDVDLLKSNLLNHVDAVASLAGKTATGGRLNVNKAITACAGPADFTVSASPASQTVVQGNSATYTITVTPSGGFSGGVTLTASGQPSGAGATFTPNPIPAGSTSATMTVTTSANTPTGSSTITVTGTSGTLSHSTNVTLAVNAPPPPDFSISASPSSQTVTPGGGTSYTITIGALNGFTSSVTLTAGTLPAGLTATFTPPTVTGSGTSTLAISTVSTTAAGSYTIGITGTSGLTHTTSVTLVVNAPTAADFTLSASPGSRSVRRGTAARYTITVTPSGGFASAVGFSVSGLPAGATASFLPTAVTGSGSTTLTVDTTGAAASRSTLTVTGSGGGRSHTVSVSLTVK